MMKKITCAVLFFTVCFNLSAFCQNDASAAKSPVAGLKTLSGDHIIEKAYLHFDKPYYAAGDTMYFKAYVTLGEHHNLSKASGILYVDLIDPANTIVNTIKLQLINGLAWGDFTLPQSSSKGNYRVRAYTRYMQNAADYFYDQTIPIGSVINTGNTSTNAANAQVAKADLQFFPEGGELITSMVTKVAFKAIGTNGLGLNVKGVVVDNTNSQVATFTSSHLGMGSFYIQPDEGKTYKAKVTFADGTQNTFNLPAPVSKGIELAVKDTLNNISIEIRCNKAYFQENLNKDINLVIYSGGLVSSVNTKLDSRRLSMDVPNSQFPTGVVQVTLFSQTGEPLSERLLFLQNPDLVNLTVNSDKVSYSKREHIVVNVNAKDKGVGATGHFSVSVIDENKVPFDENNETTILTYLLLTSDLKGYIEQPNYYFLHNTNQTSADLDALMLTQGYRRFAWKQLLTDNSKFTYTPETTFDISGSAKTTNGAPVVNKDLMLTASIGGSVLGEKTDSEGKFKFGKLIFNDSTSFTLRATGSTKTSSTTLITVDKDKPGPMVGPKDIPGTQDDVNRNMITYLKNIQAQRNNAFGSGDNAVTKAGGAPHADQVVSGDDIRSSKSLITALTGRLNDVTFTQGLPYLKGKSANDPMLIVFDGKMLGSYVNLDSIDPGIVQSIEVLKGANTDSYGIYGSAGVLVIKSTPGSKSNIGQNESYGFQSKKVIKLNAITVKENKGSYRSSSLSGPGHADQVVRGDDIRNSPSLSIALNGLLRGVDFRGTVPYLSGGSVITGIGSGSEPMLVIVDGSDASGGVDVVNVSAVETVEVLKGPNASIYGIQGGAGVLVITTRQLDASGATSSNLSALGSLQFMPKGFYKARDFYVPKYETAKPAANWSDLRSTIFWKPEVITDNDGNVSFDFYNADGKGTYRLVIEGIDNAGNIGRQVYRYKVE